MVGQLTFPRLGLLLCGTLLLAGCGGGGAVATKGEMAPEERHILKVASLYAQYKREHKEKAPASLDDLKAYAKKLPKEKQHQFGVEDPERMFISPRDNQPYGLNKVGPESEGMNRILVYEKVGVNGRRMTASPVGTVAEMDEGEFRKWVK